MAEVEVDEVFRFCSGLVSPRLKQVHDSQLQRGRVRFVPCVTKLPKFLPTMQCHVAPFFESNCVEVLEKLEELSHTPEVRYLALDVLSNVLQLE